VRCRPSGTMVDVTSPDDAELQSLASSLEDAKARVVALAQRLDINRHEDAAASLFEVERALANAVRQLGVTRRRLG